MLLGSSRFTAVEAGSGQSEGLVFSIGDFSKITGLTVKTLRYYHEQGLLIPTCVDEQTGYRYYDNEYREDDADFEACMPIRGGNTTDGITTRELAGGRCVALLHLGPYDQLGRSYAKILEYVRNKGYEVLSPTREVYLKGPGMIFRGNPQNYLTEIQMLIKE